MKQEQKFEVAQWTVKQALEHGADEVAVNIRTRSGSTVEVRNQQIDRLEQSIECELSIRLFVQNRYAVFSTNRLKKRELKKFIKEAVQSTLYLSKDKFRSLPQREEYYKGTPKDLQIFDPQYTAVKPKQKIELAFDLEKEIWGKDKRLISASCVYSDLISEKVVLDSNGFSGQNARTFFDLTCEVSVDGKMAKPESVWWENHIFLDRLIKKDIAKTALERALGKIGQKKVKSGKMDMIVENRTAANLLSPVMSALSGRAVQQDFSFLIGKLGEKVFSERLSITDKPFLISGAASKHFDGEGLPTQKRMVIEKGVLNNYYLNTYYAKKLKIKPTNGKWTNLVVKQGSKNLYQLIQTMGKGILVSGFNGGNCNPSTGDFSYGIDGFLIENGKIKFPVYEMNISGNMIELWNNLKETANDAYKNSAWQIPSLHFKNVDFSGL